MEIHFHEHKPAPSIPRALYTLAWPAVHLKRLCVGAARLESFLLRSRLQELRIDRPIYVVGLARAGTTITLEMLSHHPALAAHSYADMIQPYTVVLWKWLNRLLPLSTDDLQERPHRDGVMYNRSSPEAVEEVFWMRFFRHLHSEHKCSVLGSEQRHALFDVFYENQIKKLLLARSKTRYLAKANYNLTRMHYLAELFPSAKFVILVRDPVSQLISYIKQQDLLSQLYEDDPRWWTIASELGHFEFGKEMRFVHTGEPKSVEHIRRLWDAGDRIQAFARYWSNVYDFVADILESDSSLQAACHLVRYEDLCSNPEGEIDSLLAHCELDPVGFRKAKQEYVKRLRPPDYYQASVSDSERARIRSITAKTATRLGYEPQCERRVCLSSEPAKNSFQADVRSIENTV